MRRFSRAAERRSSFERSRGSFRSWLFTIAANQRSDFLRALARRIEVCEADGSAADALAENPEVQLTLRDSLTRALRKLTQRQRDVLLLTAWEGFTYAETAAILNIRPGSVAAHRDKAVKRLRKLLDECSPSGRRDLAPALVEGRIRA